MSESRFIRNGQAYIAIDADEYGCLHCIFAHDFDFDCYNKVRSCYADEREDGREVIWQKETDERN